MADPPAEWSAELARHLRVLLQRADAWSRESVATSGTLYIPSYLHSRHSRWRFGFHGPFAETVMEVADLEVAELLRPEAGSGGAPYPALAQRLAGALLRRGIAGGSDFLPGRAGEQSPPRGRPFTLSTALVGWMLSCTDMDLVLAFRAVLRLRAEQGAYRRWREEHPVEARMERSLRRSLQGAAGRSLGLRLHRDRRGCFVLARGSDLCRPRVDREEIRRAVQGLRSFTGPAILTHLAPLLSQVSEHGGYCHLLDVARTACEVRFDLYARSIAGHDAPGLIDDLPSSIVLEIMRRSLETLAHTILDGRKLQVPLRLREIWTEVAVEMVLRDCWGPDPRWQGYSQRDMLEELLGSDPGPLPLAIQDRHVTYLVRSIRRRWGT